MKLDPSTVADMRRATAAQIAEQGVAHADGTEAARFALAGLRAQASAHGLLSEAQASRIHELRMARADALARRFRRATWSALAGLAVGWLLGRD